MHSNKTLKIQIFLIYRFLLLKHYEYCFYRSSSIFFLFSKYFDEPFGFCFSRSPFQCYFVFCSSGFNHNFIATSPGPCQSVSGWGGGGYSPKFGPPSLPGPPPNFFRKAKNLSGQCCRWWGGGGEVDVMIFQKLPKFSANNSFIF